MLMNHPALTTVIIVVAVLIGTCRCALLRQPYMGLDALHQPRAQGTLR
jgi:hypothetical protein